MHSHSTTVRELRWAQAQDWETRYLSAQNAARERAIAASEVSASYDFARADDYCFFKADGTPVQLAMRLTGKNGRASLVVICKLVDGEKAWFITDVKNANFEAGVYILAVETRIERNRLRALGGQA